MLFFFSATGLEGSAFTRIFVRTKAVSPGQIKLCGHSMRP